MGDRSVQMSSSHLPNYQAVYGGGNMRGRPRVIWLAVPVCSWPIWATKGAASQFLNKRDAIVVEATPMALRRLSDLLFELDMVEVLALTLRADAGPHLLTNVGLRLTNLHRRMDELERQVRARARGFGEDDEATFTELRRRLAAIERNPRYHGPERRRIRSSLCEPA